MGPLYKVALLRIFAFMLLASLSPLLFVHVEYTDKDNREEKFQLLLSLYKSMAVKYNMTIAEFNNFSNVAYEALSEPKPRWTYVEGMDFVWQTLTTIGYGYITPQTPTGQILCIFVSLIGIPITLLTLKSVGELITKLVNTVVTKFEKKALKRVQPKNVQSKSAAILVALMLVLMIANSFLTKLLQGWTLIEGVYYWFITCTTIGFGDYVFQQPQKIKQLSVNGSGKFVRDADEKKLIFVVLQKKLITLYSLIALCIVASVLNSIMAAIEERRCPPPCPGCLPLKTQDHPDDNVQHDIPKQYESDHITCLNMENTGMQRTNIGLQALSETE